jgi:electron transfer flavoprotein beta subunit|tara:strand:+ start:3284 stop:4105 length:822 start_codon:yes stop_codon:yes gene_type:complete
VRIVVCAKQVVDPLTALTALQVDQERKKILGPANSSPVINGYDEQALEAALRIKDAWRDGECEVLVLSAGADFNLDVMKGALAAGADDLILVRDAALDTWDSHFLARVLAAAIRHLGGADLVLCGRQASDWDQAQAPLMLAELLGWACLTLARWVEVQARRVQIERVLSDGFQVMESDLPAVVTVTSELGDLRYPLMRARLMAKKRRPQTLTLSELGVEAPATPAMEVLKLSLHEETRDCQFVESATGAEAGRRLAEVLLDAGLVKPKPPEGA